MKRRSFRLERSQHIPRPLPEVFAFFSQAQNLELLTPAFLNFRFTSTPPPIQPGALIEYQLRLFGIPFRWLTRIETFEPGRRFSDIQLRGPYARWFHRHEFSETPQGTLMRDIVDYELPWGPLGRLARALFVRQALERIFDYRRRKIDEIFPAPSGATMSEHP
jgi:ligand-binding SRPBCC domain-containing protein